MKCCYDLNGLRLAIEAEPADLIAPIEQYVAPFTTVASDVHDYSISIGRGPIDELPDDAEIIFEGDMLPGFPSRLALKGDGTWLLVAGRLSAISEQTPRVTKIKIGEGCNYSLLSLAGIRAIDTALAASGQYLLHGAGLAPPGNEARALLVFAPSGVGKTTTALALALGGFGLITDDAIVLQPRGYKGHVPAHAWGLPRSLKVHRRTADLLTTIRPLLGTNWDSAGEQVLQTTALNKVARTVPPAPIPITAIAILRGPSPSGHHFAPLGKAEALRYLVEDNIRRSRLGVPADHVKRFEVLGTLVATTPTFELRVGAPLTSLPDFVATALSDYLPQESASVIVR